jgi:integrase
MTWVPSQTRWLKEYRSKTYGVSCRQLSKWLGRPIPATKEGSWREANAWWDVKRAEIDAAARVAHMPVDADGVPFDERQQALDAIREKINWARHFAPQEVPALLQTEKAIEEADPADGLPTADAGEIRLNIEVARALGVQVPEDLDPIIVQHLFGPGRVWQDRFARTREVPQTHQKMTLRYHADQFKELLRAKCRDKPGTYGEQDRLVELSVNIQRKRQDGQVIEAVTHAEMLVGQITEQTFQKCFLVLSGMVNAGEITEETARKRLRMLKRLIKYLWGQRLVELPRNLDSEEFRFQVAAREIVVPERGRVVAVVAALPPRLRLYALLALNCAMNQADLAELKHTMVDWQEGRIRRKRVKTKKEKNVPEVDYPLWPETLELLKQFRSDHPELVLTTQTGGKLVDRMYKEGDNKTGKKDMVQLAWKRWWKGTPTKPCPAAGPRIQFKELRAFGATVIESHELYGRYKGHYLGHAPRTVADKHYAKPSRELFDQIVKWLRDQIFGAGKP